MPTKVNCDQEKCAYNDDGECAHSKIQLDEEGVCLDYDNKRNWIVPKV